MKRINNFNDLKIGHYYEDGTGESLVFVGKLNDCLAMFHGTEYNDTTGNLDDTNEIFYKTIYEVKMLSEI